MLVFIVKIVCCSKKRFFRDLDSPDSRQLLQLQLSSQIFKILGLSLLILSCLVLLVSWTRLFLCYNFGFSWVWIEFNCLPLSEDEWLFFVYRCLTMKFEVFDLWIDFLYRCRRSFEQWIGAVVVYPATVAEDKFWMSWWEVMFFSDVFISFVYLKAKC